VRKVSKGVIEVEELRALLWLKGDTIAGLNVLHFFRTVLHHRSLGVLNLIFVTYPVASDSEWRVTQEWRSIKNFPHNSLYINRVFLLSFFSLYHRIYTRFSLSTIATIFSPCRASARDGTTFFGRRKKYKDYVVIISQFSIICNCMILCWLLSIRAGNVPHPVPTHEGIALGLSYLRQLHCI